MQQNLVNIKLFGDLGKVVGKNWKLAVNSTAECLRAIELNSGNKLYKYLLEKDKEGIRYRVLLNGRDAIYDGKATVENPKSALESELCVKFKNGSLKTIDIVPVLEANNSGFFAAFLGALLIIIGIVLIVGSGGAGSPFGTALIIGGLGLLAAGVTALLSRPPKFDDFREIDGQLGRTSYLFNGPQNVTREGGPVSAGYGRLLIGSQVISASYVVKNIDAGNITVLNFSPGSIDSNFHPGTSIDVTLDNNDFVFDLGPAGNVYTHYLTYSILAGSPQIGGYSAIKFNEDGSPQDITEPNSYTFNYNKSSKSIARQTQYGILGIHNAFIFGTARCLISKTVLDGDAVIIGGSFSIFVRQGIITEPIQNLLYVNPDGTININDTMQPDGPVFCSYSYTGNYLILIGGSFSNITTNNATRQYRGLARIGNANGVMGDIDTSFTDPNIQGGSVYCVAKDSNNKIYIGGNFTSVGGSARIGLARLNIDGTLDTGFPDLQLKYVDSVGNQQNATVYGIAVHDGVPFIDKIVFGGNFTRVSGNTRNLIARTDSTGTLDSTVSFAADIASANDQSNFIKTIDIQHLDQKILVGGAFDNVNNTRYNNIVRLNTDGTIDTTFKIQTESTSNSIKRVGTNGRVDKIIIREVDGKIFVGGQFTKYGDSDAVQIMRLNNGGYIS